MSDKRFFRIPCKKLIEEYTGGPPLYEIHSSLERYINNEIKRITKKPAKWKRSGKNKNIIFCFDGLSKTNTALLTSLSNDLLRINEGYEQKHNKDF